MTNQLFCAPRDYAIDDSSVYDDPSDMYRPTSQSRIHLMEWMLIGSILGLGIAGFWVGLCWRAL